LVTGATGFVGSHVAERLSQHGYRVRTLVRGSSDTRWLDARGFEQVVGELQDGAAVGRAMQGVQLVVHCAAMVGDWGPVEAFRRVNVDGLRSLLDAARGQPLERFIHTSSLGVYEARDHFGTDESTALPSAHIDGYTQTKVESEQLALEYGRSRGVPVTALRPGLVYGPRDRNVIPRVLDAIRSGRFRYLGSGEQAMNSIYVGNFVDALMLALQKPHAIGQVYNLTDLERISKRRFIETLARLAGYPPPERSIPLPLARAIAGVLEPVWRALGREKPPILSQALVKFLGLNLEFSCEKAVRELGYAPRVEFDKAMATTVDWLRAEGMVPPLAAPK
ncbi:MAG: NAD-dependent epimerase/dehydratase family protein, partial [bacterium]